MRSVFDQMPPLPEALRVFISELTSSHLFQQKVISARLNDARSKRVMPYIELPNLAEWPVGVEGGEVHISNDRCPPPPAWALGPSVDKCINNVCSVYQT